MVSLPLTLLAGLAVGQARVEPSVPPPLQAKILKRVLVFDRTLADREIAIQVLYPEPLGAEASALVRALAEAGLAASAAPIDRTPQADTNVMYVLGDAVPPSIQRLAVERRSLTVGARVPMVERGEAAVAIGIKDNRPEIVVKLSRVKAEGHDLSSSLLNLARVVP